MPATAAAYKKGKLYDLSIGDLKPMKALGVRSEELGNYMPPDSSRLTPNAV